MQLRRTLSLVSPVLLVIGCDFLGSAYQTGFDGGYAVVDAFFSCAASCERERLARRAEVAAWDRACTVDVTDAFADQPALDRANEHCADEGRFDSAVVLCRDEGQAVGTERPGCAPFERPALGVPVAASYACPDGVTGALMCLCCEGASTASCVLSGGFCRDDERCCSGVCDLEIADAGSPLDGGVGDAPRGSCR